VAGAVILEGVGPLVGGGGAEAGGTAAVGCSPDCGTTVAPEAALAPLSGWSSVGLTCPAMAAGCVGGAGCNRSGDSGAQLARKTRPIQRSEPFLTLCMLDPLSIRAKAR